MANKSPSSSAAIEVVAVEREDIDDMVRIEFAAYNDNPLACVLRRRESSNSAHWQFAHDRYSQMVGRVSLTQHFAKIVTNASDESIMLGWMRWEDYTAADTIDSTCMGDNDSFRPQDDQPSDANVLDMMRTYNATIEGRHAEVMRGQPHLRKPALFRYGVREQTLMKAHQDLALLVVDPQCQRRGAGQQLLRHFLNECDRRALPAYLISSPKAKGLYERHGFEAHSDLVFPADRWGRNDVRVQTVMVRQVTDSA